MLEDTDSPKLKKRKDAKPFRKCQNIIDDGLYSGEERKCTNFVDPPNKFLCNECLRTAESEEQILGVIL